MSTSVGARARKALLRDLSKMLNLFIKSSQKLSYPHIFILHENFIVRHK